LLVSLAGQVYLLDKESGHLHSQIKLSSAIYTTPSTDGSMVYICQSDGSISAFDVENLSLRWSHKLDGPITVPALVLNNKIVVGTEKKDLHILDKVTGQTLQRIELEGRLRAQPLVCKRGLIVAYEYRKLAYFKVVEE